MKRFFLWLFFVLLAVALFIGSVVGYAYYKTETAPPAIAPSFGGKELTLNGYVWNASVLNGLTFKQEAQPRTLSADALGEFEALHPELNVPDTMLAQLQIKDSDKNEVFNGYVKDYADFSFSKNGDYTITVLLTTQPNEQKSSGELYFNAKFTIDVKPKIEINSERLYQGDVVNIIVKDILDDNVPQIETELSHALFTKKDGYYTATAGIAYNREPGKYPVSITCGDTLASFEVEVIAAEFERQDLTMSEEVSSATNTAAANYEFNQKIVSLYNTADENTYWDGMFKQPCDGRITSEYGLRRYTNGARVPVRHGGIDIACPEGTFIAAPNNGKVIFAELITLTGNTVVVEHGGGLKSYFYHMSSIAVENGQLVEKDMKIGEVGTTGYSTGPHLHYEVKIGNQSINPWKLFNGSSGVFYKAD